MITTLIAVEYYSMGNLPEEVIQIATLFKYKYTTGPVSVSENIDNIRVLVSNNGSKKHQARIKIFNLDPSPKKQVFDQTFTINSHSQTGTEFIPMFNYFEVQVLTDSPLVLIWVGGRSGNENLVGNVILHKELVRF